MGMIPPEFIEELNSRLDIVELISSYVVLKKQGRNYVGLCPFHSENTPSFIVTPDKGIYHCFGCHEGGNGIGFLMAIEHLTFPEAVEKLAERLGMQMPRQDITPAEQAKMRARKDHFKLHELARDFYQEYLWSKAGEEARCYLERRGLTPEIVKKFALGFAPDKWDALLVFLQSKGYSQQQLLNAGLITLKDGLSGGKSYDRFRDRVMFPILDFKGQVVAFGGRTMSSDKTIAKYLNSPETEYFKKSQHLYGLYQSGTEIRQSGRAVIMEGYMDVIAAHQYGVNNAVAALGTAFNAEHAKLLQRYTDQVLLAFDGDAAGVAAANKSMDVLRGLGFKLRVVHFPDGQDPDEFIRSRGKAGWDAYVETAAQDFWDYKLQQALKKHDVGSVTGKSSVLGELMPYLRSCHNQVELDGIVSLLARSLAVDKEAVYAELRRSGRQAEQQPETAPEIKPEQNAKAAPPDRAEANLVFLMLQSEKIWQDVETELGFGFTAHPCLKSMIETVRGLLPDYHWRPSDLFTYINDDNTRKLLLQMLGAEIDPESRRFAELARGLINGFLIKRKRLEIEEKQGRLKNLTKVEDKLAILSQIKTLQQEVRQLLD